MMGFLDKLMGLGGEGSDSKKQEIKALFHAKADRSGSYTVLAAMNMVTEKKLLKEVRTFYNYIIGYQDGDDPEIVIISTDNELSFTEEPVYCKRSECLQAEYLEKLGMFSVTHPALGAEPISFGIIASTAWDGYVIRVSYADEFMPFFEFFQNRFAK